MHGLLHDLEDVLDNRGSSWRPGGSSVVALDEPSQSDGCPRADSSHRDLSPDRRLVAENVTVDDTSKELLFRHPLSTSVDFLPDHQQLEVLLHKLHQSLEFVNGTANCWVVINVREDRVGGRLTHSR